jgi:transcriptional regulator with XRE-family HTH domain
MTTTATTPILSKLADFVSFKRKELGLTQTQLAHKINSIGDLSIDKSYVSKIEKQTLKGMELNTLSSLIEALDCKVTFVSNN